jgi:DDE superfamily endonuclease
LNLEPQNARVLGIDKKSSIQALEQARGFLKTSRKIIQGMKSNCKRYGTIQRFTALELATGVIRGKKTQTRRVGFQVFTEEIIVDQPAYRRFRVNLDNLNTHKINGDSLAACPTVTFDFTPTRTSWLKQVEVWFGILQRKSLNNAGFRNIDQLIEAMCARTTVCN